MSSKVLENIFTVNLGVKKSERALVFTDLTDSRSIIRVMEMKELQDVARSAVEAGSQFCETNYLEYPSTGSHGEEPPDVAWRAAFGARTVKALINENLFKKVLAKEASADELIRAEEIVAKFASDGVDAVIALSKYSTSHTNFRKWITSIVGARYASMPNFERIMLDGAMNVNWKALEARTLALQEMMKNGESVRVTANNGTDISFSVKGRKVLADTGIITGIGAFSNLPAGEAFLAPVEGTAQGTLVLDWAPMRKLDSHVVVEVKSGRAVSAEGDDPYAAELSAILESDPVKGNIAELGIGTNDMATRPDNILESEKILGTIHIAFGDNSTFGGKVRVPFHQDYVFFDPTLKVIKGNESVLVIDGGKPLF